MNAEVVLDPNATGANAARILVVEDERIVARSLRMQLTSLGYEVADCVPSGEEAILNLESARADMVLMDINLEGPMDGVEAASLIRARFRIPVVYLTAYSNPEILERAKVTEPFGYILKPYDDRELHVAIETGIYKHRMEQHQRQREQWLVATLKGIGDAVVTTDAGGLIEWINPMAERLTGWSNREANGHILQGVVRLVHKGTRRPVEFPLGMGMHHDDTSDDILLIAKDGSEKAIEDCVSTIIDEQGAVLGRVVVFRDVTSRKHLEKLDRQAKKMEAVSQLAGGVAHALNNLMTVVLGFSDVMLNGMKPEDRFFACVVQIKRSAMCTVALTQKLLAFSRQQSLAVHPVNLNGVINGLAPVIRLMQSSVRLDLNLEPSLGLTRVEPFQLEAGIITLVRNACQAMPQGGHVGIQTANVELGQETTHDHPGIPPGAYVMLAVSDNGAGMDPEAISHLFEPFYTPDTGVGAGLGLAAVYGFIQQCGGDIDVRSRPDIGTTFRIYLPRHVSDSEAGTP